MNLIRIVYVSPNDGHEHVVLAQNIINHVGKTIVARFADGKTKQFDNVVKIGH